MPYSFSSSQSNNNNNKSPCFHVIQNIRKVTYQLLVPFPCQVLAMGEAGFRILYLCSRNNMLRLEEKQQPQSQCRLRSKEMRLICLNSILISKEVASVLLTTSCFLEQLGNYFAPHSSLYEVLHFFELLQEELQSNVHQNEVLHQNFTQSYFVHGCGHLSKNNNRRVCIRRIYLAGKL